MIREEHNLPAQNSHRFPSVVAVGTLLLRPIIAALFVGLTFLATATSIQAQTTQRSKSTAASKSQSATRPQALPPELVNRLQQQVKSGSDKRNADRESSERSAESSSSAVNTESEFPAASWQRRGQSTQADESSESAGTSDRAVDVSATASSADAQSDSEPSLQEMVRESLRRKAAAAPKPASAPDDGDAQPALKKTPEPRSASRAAMTSRDASEFSGIQQASATSEEPNETSDQSSESVAVQEPDAPFLDLEPTVRTGGANSPEQSPEVTLATSPGNIIVRAVVWLVIAFCLLILAVLGVRRYQRSRGLLPSTGNQSRVVETLSVGPGRSVSLIEIAGLRALVAADAGGIKTLVLAPSIFPDELQREMEQPMPLETVHHGQTIAEL